MFPQKYLLCSLFVLTTATVPPSQTAAEALESSGVEIVERGFIFLDGQAIPPPYRITIEGSRLTINEHVIHADDLDLSGLPMVKSLGDVRQRTSSRQRPPGRDRVRGDEGRPNLMHHDPGRHDPGRRNPMRRSSPPRSGGAGPPVRPSPGNPASNRRTERRDDAREMGSAKSWREPAVASRRTDQRLLGLVRQIRLLDTAGSLVLDSGKKPWDIWPSMGGFECLLTLCEPDIDKRLAVEVPSEIAQLGHVDRWNDLMHAFVPDADFQSRVDAVTADYRAAQVLNTRQSMALLWSQRIAYPLTVVALILVVLAVGHLMANAQVTFATVDQPVEPKFVRGVVHRSLAILAAMSAIDLIWTILASQNGSMRELNPIGSRMIEDPSNLIAFKIVVTAISIGLLYRLRDLPLTRKASWWCCLVLTLLTVRWLTFHSMLV